MDVKLRCDMRVILAKLDFLIDFAIWFGSMCWD